MVPERKLFEMSRTLRSVNNPIDEGISEVKRFECKNKSISAVKFPKDSGIGPSRLLSKKSRTRRPVISPISDGNVPESWRTKLAQN
jgi:hypothetical protein